MNSKDHMSGAESAARILGHSKWPAINRCVGANDEPCKFPDCNCAETGLVCLPVLDTMTDDREILLHRVDASKLGPRDGVSVGGCVQRDALDEFIEALDSRNDVDPDMRRLAAFWILIWFVLVIGGFVAWAIA